MRKAILWFAVGVMATVLFASNPTQEDFDQYLTERVEERLGGDTEDGSLGRLMTNLGSQVVASLATRISERTSFGLFTLYSVDVGADGNPDEDWRFLGIAGRFVEISSPDTE